MTTLSFLSDLFAQGIVIFYPGVFVYWMIVHNNVTRLRRWGVGLQWVAAVAWLITAVPLLYFRHDIFSVRWSAPRTLQIILTTAGLVAFVAAFVVFSRARRRILFQTMVGLAEIAPQQYMQRVLRAGIYSRTRNPIYFAHWLFVFSAAALSNYAANWIGFGLDCLILPILIRAEERELLGRFGSDFAEYMRSVPRFFPR
jgi:protein-S-isoprenylcysteine O-methyltransferase Ste14